MLADHHAGIEVLVEASAGSHAALRSLDQNPVAVGDHPRTRRVRIQLHFRVQTKHVEAFKNTLDKRYRRFEREREKQLREENEKRIDATVASPS
jgi:hypothetical protein